MRPVTLIVLHLIALLLMLLGGCRDEVDLTGIYVVDANVASAPCGVDLPVPDAPAYVKLAEEELFGSTYFSLSACTDETGTDCTSIGGLFGGFSEPIDDGWRGITTYSSGSGASCSLGMTVRIATLGGNQLVIESYTYEEGADLPADECSPEEAERRGDAMACTAHDRLEATRL